MPSKGNINIVHDEQIWRDHIRTGIHLYRGWFISNIEQMNGQCCIQVIDSQGVIWGNIKLSTDFSRLAIIYGP